MPMQPLPGLDVVQTRALFYEANATRNTLAYALRILATDALTENTRDPVMVLSASGIERLLKLTLGVIDVDQHQQWRDSKSHGHHVERMHHRVLDAIEQRAAAAPYVGQLLAVVRGDAVLPPLIACADSFAREGRYAYFTTLADKQPHVDSPDQAWRAVEDAAAQHPELAELQAQAMAHHADNEKQRAARIARGSIISNSLTNLWDLVTAAGTHHALGDLGHVLSQELKRSSVGRQ